MSDDKDTNETDTPTQMEAEQATQDSASEMDTAEAILETAEAALEEGATSAEEAPEAAPAPPTPEEQIATLNDQVLRTLAELENTRRRAERDRRVQLHRPRSDARREQVVLDLLVHHDEDENDDRVDR